MGVKVVSTASCPCQRTRRAASTAQARSPRQRTSNSSTAPRSASCWKKRPRTDASRPSFHGSPRRPPSQAPAGGLACSTSWPGMAVTTIAIGVASISARSASAARALATSSCLTMRSRSSSPSMPLNTDTSRPISSRPSQDARSVWSPVRRTSSATPARWRSGRAIERATTVTTVRITSSSASAVPRCMAMRTYSPWMRVASRPSSCSPAPAQAARRSPSSRRWAATAAPWARPSAVSTALRAAWRKASMRCASAASCGRSAAASVVPPAA